MENTVQKKEYSAGMVKLSFWFQEFRRVAGMIDSGLTMDEIKEKCLGENLFGAPTRARAEQIWHTISSRVRSLDQSFFSVFTQGDISTQKIICLTTILMTDSLFFDFAHEVIREELFIGSDELTDSDIRIFFKNKQVQSPKVAGWQDYTIHRLGTCYKTLLTEAGLLERAAGARKILRPIVDKNLETCMKSNGMEPILHALTGVR